MARIRNIKPEFFSDKRLSTISAHARLLYIALWQLADKNGTVEYIPMQIHAHAFPWEAEVNTQALLRELEGISALVFFETGGKDYLHLKNFAKHQRISGKESQSEAKHPLYKENLKQEFEGSTGEAPGKHLDAQYPEIPEVPEVQSKDNVELGNSTAIREVFEHWQIVMQHPKAKLDGNRKSEIGRALKLGFSLDECKAAIDGCSVTPHNIGQNDRGTRYDGLHVIFRNAESVERFISNASNPPTNNGTRQPTRRERVEANIAASFARARGEDVIAGEFSREH